MSVKGTGPQLLREYSRGMRFRQIEVFHAVYTHGSISAAARALGVSQPSVSKTLRHAEDGLGFALFQLARGRLVPTDEAHALMHEAGDIFDRITSLQHTARNLSQAGGGHIRLGIVPSLALDVVPQAMAQFRREWPRVTFEVHTHHHDDLVQSLIERETDIAIAYTPPRHPRLTRSLLAEGELVVFFPDGAFADAGPRLALDQLADRDVIGVAATGPIGDVLTRAARDRGITYRESVSVQTFFIAARLAVARLSLAAYRPAAGVHRLLRHAGGPAAVEDRAPVPAHARRHARGDSRRPPIAFGYGCHKCCIFALRDPSIFCLASRRRHFPFRPATGGSG